MKRLIVAAGIAFAVCAQANAQAPLALSAPECEAFADLAVVAAAAAKHRVPRERLEAMLPDIYNVGEATAREVTRRILDEAYLEPIAAVPEQFARQFVNRCFRARGVIDAFLGVRF